MYFELDDFTPYYDKISVNFGTHISRNLRCIHGYTNCVGHNDLITWVSKNPWEVLLYDLKKSENTISYPKRIICNNFEQNILLVDILNTGDNIDDREYYGVRGSFFKIAPTVIDDYTKNKWMNMQIENLRPQKNKENNENNLMKVIR